MKLRFSLLLIILATLPLLAVNNSYAATNQIMGNFTISSSNYQLTSNLNYSGWIIILNNSGLISNGYNIQADKILIQNNSLLEITNGTGLIDIYSLYNNGTVEYTPNFLNVTNLYNNGQIVHQNWLGSYENLPYSYGGSGGGGGTNYGSGATQGYNTRASGGAVGNDPASPGSQAPLFGNSSTPIFNESLLSGVAGGSSCTPGAYGAFGFIIRTDSFENLGSIANEGQSAPMVCYGTSVQGGGGGAGGGGVLEIIYNKTYLNRGSFDLNGGSLNKDFNGPYTYGGWGGAGGQGQAIIVKFPYNLVLPANNTVLNTTNNTNKSSSTLILQENLSSITNTVDYLNKTLYNLAAGITGYAQELSNINDACSLLASNSYQIYQNSALLDKSVVMNLTAYYREALNESSYVTAISNQFSSYRRQSTLLDSTPSLSVLNSSGYSLMVENYTGGNDSFDFNIEKSGYYRIKFSMGGKSIYLGINGTNNSLTQPKQNPLMLIPSYLFSNFFFLPFLVYNLVI